MGAGNNQILCVPPIWDGNENSQKAFPLFGTGAGNQKKVSLCLGTEIHGVPVWKYRGTGIPATIYHEQFFSSRWFPFRHLKI